MKLVSVRCPSCGATVEVDEYSKSFTCNSCGVSTIIEKDSYNKNYNDSSIEKAEYLIATSKNYNEAKTKYKYITTNDPLDPRAWLGLVRCYTRDLTEKMYIYVEGIKPIWLSGMENRIISAYNEYLKVEKKETEKARVKEVFDKYYNLNKEEFNNLNNQYKEEEINLNINSGDVEYNETIKAENKIIKSEDIRNIIVKMNEILIKYKEISSAENKKNEMFDFDEKEYSFEDQDSNLKFYIDFYDNTSVNIDNFDQFITIFDTRLSEIKYFDIHFTLSYRFIEPYPNKINEYRIQRIDITIRENKLDLSVKLDSKDNKLNSLYSMIKNIILNSNEKYDSIIKNKTIINLVVTLGYGLMFGIVIGLLPMLIESIRGLYFSTKILYPTIAIISGSLIGTLISSGILNPKYKTIVPDKKYAGYSDGKSIYKDDIESFVNSSEILIGKNIDNLKYREEIKKYYENGKSKLFLSLFIIIVISVVIVIISFTR